MASYGSNNKKDLIKEYALTDNDTGSVELQLSLLTHRINLLVDHLKKHKKDHHTRMGLLKMVGRRKKFIKHLSETKPDEWKALAKKLNLKVKSK